VDRLKTRRARAVLLVFLCGLAAAAPRWVQDKPGGGRARISIYHVAPGKQLEFLKWMALDDEVAKEAGIPGVQLYAHLDGDSWDYVGLGPATTPEQDKKKDDIAAKHGLKTGLPSALEFRALLTSHTDTFVVGPVTAAELVAQAVR
jgi:hypothetical protein